MRTAVGTEDRGNAVAIQPDGKIVVVGRSRPGATYFDYAIARYNTDGSLDASFGGGAFLYNLFPGFATDDEAYAVLIDAAGKILVLGSSRGTTGGFYRTGLIRFNPDGTPDASFGAGGKVISDRAVDKAMALQADGKIVCGGGGGEAQLADYRLQRFNVDGSLDTTFGTSGFVQIDFAGSGDGVWGIAIQPDGKIVAAGRSRILGGNDNFAVARLNTDGTLDPTFGSGGKVTTDFDNRTDLGFAVTLQPDGKIIVAGQARTDVNEFDFGLVRYNPDGSLDSAFGDNGRVRTGFGVADSAYAVKLQSNGKIVAAGVEGGVSTGFAVARYNTDGSLDPTFDGDGRATTYFEVTDYARGLAIQPDGKIVAAGTADGGADLGDFALARFFGDPVAPGPFSVSGRLLTEDGRAVSGTMVILTYPDQTFKAALSNPFGYYGFTDVPGGGPYTLSVSSKRYELRPKQVYISQNLTGVDLIVTAQ